MPRGQGCRSQSPATSRQGAAVDRGDDERIGDVEDAGGEPPSTMVSNARARRLYVLMLGTLWRFWPIEKDQS
jgi:hypothetical protein